MRVLVIEREQLAVLPIPLFTIRREGHGDGNCKISYGRVTVMIRHRLIGFANFTSAIMAPIIR
jgi:hypothetical protein